MSNLDPDDQRDMEIADKMNDKAAQAYERKRADALAKCMHMGHVMRDFKDMSSVCDVCGQVLREQPEFTQPFSGNALHVRCLLEGAAVHSLCKDIQSAARAQNTPELLRKVKTLERIAFRWYMKTDEGRDQ